VMQFDQLVVVILAGNDEDPSVLGGVGQPSKFFMAFDDERVGDRVLRAIDALGCCRAIYIAVPPAQVRRHPFASEHPLHLVPQREVRTESLLNAIGEACAQGHYADGDHVLVVAGDLPLLSTAALERFIVACQEAQEADCYIGMIPLPTIAPTLRPVYQREIMPFRGGLYLHSDVYLLRPVSLTEVGRRRFEQIVRIRRLERDSLRDMLKAAATVLGIVGLRGALPFARMVLGWCSTSPGNEGQARSTLDRVERVALELVQQKLGPSVTLLSIDEPTLALGFDSREQFEVLIGYAGSAERTADVPPH